jgi:hypothetical protein
MKNKTALRSAKYEMQDGPGKGRISEREKTRGPIHTRHLTNLAFREEAAEAEMMAFMDDTNSTSNSNVAGQMGVEGEA